MRIISVLLVGLLCAAVLGVIAPTLIGAAVASLDPNASDKWDDIYFFQGICCLFVVGPVAAGVASYSVSRKLLARPAGDVPAARNGPPALSIAAGLLAVLLSWLLLLNGWIFDLLSALHS